MGALTMGLPLQNPQQSRAAPCRPRRIPSPRRLLRPLPKRRKGEVVAKPKKKKWSKGKVRDKLNNLVLFDKATHDKLLKEVPSYKLITPSVVSERLKISGSLARRSLDDLQQKGLIRQVVKHHAQLVYP